MEVLVPQTDPILNADATLSLLVVSITRSFVAFISRLLQCVPRTDTLFGRGKDLLDSQQVDSLRA